MRLRHAAFTVCVVVLLSYSPAAQTPSAAGFSPDRLARIDPWLQRYVDENRIAGAVALVLRDGKPVYERAVGWSDKEAGRRMAPNTIFRIASQTKAITSAAILALMEEGKLTLTDPVSRYIPSFAGSKVAVRNDGSSCALDVHGLEARGHRRLAHRLRESRVGVRHAGKVRRAP